MILALSIGGTVGVILFVVGCVILDRQEERLEKLIRERAELRRDARKRRIKSARKDISKAIKRIGGAA